MGTNRDSGTKSPWQLLDTLVSNSKPDKINLFDVIIIGGGITGITTALLLQRQGKKCIVVEGHNLGFGTTGGTTAHINTFFDTSYSQITKDFGNEAAALVASAGNTAIEIITALTNELQINCQLESKIGYLFSQNEKQSSDLRDILESSRDAGVEVDESDKNGVPIPFELALAFAGQKQFHPLEYILGLAQEFVSLGGQISENSFISEVKSENDVYIASSALEEFSAKHLVYATHLPPGINQFNFRCAPYRSYVLGIELSDDTQYPEGMAYDMEEPYHYIRTHVIDGKKMLIVGGADHKTGQEAPEKAYLALEEYVRQYFAIRKIAYRWSSQYYIPVDGLPYIGPMGGGDDKTYVATGFNGNGMTWGTISAMIISDAILQKENTYSDLFRPDRIKPIAGFTEFVKENADVAYHFIADRFRSKHLNSLSELNSGDGMVVDFDGKKIAIYRDAVGIVSALDPTCTHAGCTVCFNPAEKSWDCPCHGGRFDLSGKVLSGPPRKDLLQVDLSKDSLFGK